jgi:hypothetical protein
MNGCVAQVIELKTRLQIAVQKHPPKVIRSRVLLPDQSIPKWMTVAVQGIYAKLTADPTRLPQIAADFSPNNLKRIEIAERPSRKQNQAVTAKS